MTTHNPIDEIAGAVHLGAARAVNGDYVWLDRGAAAYQWALPEAVAELGALLGDLPEDREDREVVIQGWHDLHAEPVTILVAADQVAPDRLWPCFAAALSEVLYDRVRVLEAQDATHSLDAQRARAHWEACGLGESEWGEALDLAAERADEGAE